MPAIGSCPRCQRVILTGHDGGLPYRVEIDPVNQRGETHAVIDGLDTYQMVAHTLAYRDAQRMTHSAEGVPVFVTHYCTRIIPNDHRNDHLPETLHARIHAHAKEMAALVEPPF